MAPERKNLKNIIILSVIIVLCIIIITVSFKDTDFLKRARASTLDLFKPVQEKTYLFFQPVVRFFTNTRDYFALKDEILALEKEKNTLIHDYSENVNLKIENDALRKLLEIKLREDYETVPAKVIGYYNSKWQSEILIDAGKTKGVLEGMAVVTDEGLAGTVILSSNYTSQVRLLNDPQSTIGSRILSSRKLGMVEGSLEKEIFLNHIATEEEVFIGDIVITSEFGEYIPPELLIGRIKKIGQPEGVYYRQIIIEPFVDYETIEYVLVLK